MFMLNLEIKIDSGEKSSYSYRSMELEITGRYKNTPRFTGSVSRR